jgi:hypothetical protein
MKLKGAKGSSKKENERTVGKKSVIELSRGVLEERNHNGK